MEEEEEEEEEGKATEEGQGQRQINRQRQIVSLWNLPKNPKLASPKPTYLMRKVRRQKRGRRRVDI